MIEINGVKYTVHYKWVYPWGSNASCCGIPIISYLERIKELKQENQELKNSINAFEKRN